MVLLVLALLVLGGVALLYAGRPLLAWVLPAAAGFTVWFLSGPALPFLFGLGLIAFLPVAAILGIPAIRRQIITPPIMRMMARILPRISKTERLALEAGTIWWDGDLFSGRPDWGKLDRFQPRALTDRERAFLDGPVEDLCRLLDDYQADQDGDITPEAWAHLKKHRFFGMIIPEEFGGLGFSAIAHSAVVAKVASRSVSGSVTVMVPNSLGPAELLLHYGTAEQKNHYLPRLAAGDEIPCFALTEPTAGSDAASGTSYGVVCRGTYEGREVLGMRLTWNKRYITLAPRTTLLGLAFRLLDPDHLLGDTDDLGITCALIPAHVDGVEVGRRHDPLGVPFLNGPTTGEDVFVPLDFIIGGPDRAGEGWRMLMDSLAAGRSISLPALAAGAAQLATRYTGAYATVREQFGLPIGRFTGIQERLARIAGFTYLMDATRTLTAGAVDAGEKPSVLSAVVKAYLTEHMRTVVNDAMDVSGGAGICQGPRNVLAHGFRALPIGITVEGANILTRSLIIYGQGAIRCHPHVLDEIHSVESGDLARFDRAFFGHVGFTVSNAVRALVLGITAGFPARPSRGGPLRAYTGQLTRLSAAFSFLSDVCMGSLGSELKRREMLSGRLADALAWMYLGSATLKRFTTEGQSERDQNVARWAIEHSLYQTQLALAGVLDNFPRRGLGPALRVLLFPLGTRLRPPADDLSRRVAEQILDGGRLREHLTGAIYIPPEDDPGLGFLEATLKRVVRAAPVERRIKDALKSGAIPAGNHDALTGALETGLVTAEEAAWVTEARAARLEAIQVDSFPAEHSGWADAQQPTPVSA